MLGVGVFTPEGPAQPRNRLVERDARGLLLRHSLSKAPNLRTRHTRNVDCGSRCADGYRQSDQPHSDNDVLTRHLCDRKRTGRQYTALRRYVMRGCRPVSSPACWTRKIKSAGQCG